MINTMEQAVKAARQGNNEGRTYLYEQTYRKAYYVAVKYMQNEDEAYDIVHDAYMKAFTRLDQLDDDSKFDKWLNTIVASTALDALKKKKPQLFSDLSPDGEEEFDVSEKFEADYSQQPEVVVDQNETARLVQEIISELSDEQRACVTMYYMQEMSVKEISGVLNVSDNTVKSRLNYARKNIEAKVKELEKKGTKLYALAPIPFFVFLLHSEADACEAVAVAGMYSASAGASAGAGTGATTGTAATTTGMSLGAKIAIGITAAVVVIGGATGVGIAVANSFDDNEQIEETADEDTSQDNTNASKTTQTAQKKLPDGVTPMHEGVAYVEKIADVIPQEDGSYVATVERMEAGSEPAYVTPEEYTTYQVGSVKEFKGKKYSCYKVDNGYYFSDNFGGSAEDMESHLIWISDSNKVGNNIGIYEGLSGIISTGEKSFAQASQDKKNYTTAKICIDKDADIELIGYNGRERSTIKFSEFVNGNKEGVHAKQFPQYAGWRNTGIFYMYGDKDGYVVKLQEKYINS